MFNKCYQCFMVNWYITNGIVASYYNTVCIPTATYLYIIATDIIMRGYN